MMELVCPAGTPASLRAAVDAGAHTVYCGFADDTNARNFPGLNFSRSELADGVAYAHRRGSKVLVAINTFPRAGDEDIWHRAVADAETAGADAVILADLGLIAHAAEHHPDLRRHAAFWEAELAGRPYFCGADFTAKASVRARNALGWGPYNFSDTFKTLDAGQVALLEPTRKTQWLRGAEVETLWF